MDFEDAKHYFSFMQICKVNDDYQYVYEECPLTPDCICKVTIDTSGEYTFSVTQKDDRLFKKDSGYSYSTASLFLMNLADGEKTYIDGNANDVRDVYLECSLEEGEYILYAMVEWKEETKEKSFVITCYGVSEAQIEDMEDEDGFEKDEIIKAAADSIKEKRVFYNERSWGQDHIARYCADYA